MQEFLSKSFFPLQDISLCCFNKLSFVTENWGVLECGLRKKAL
jgi:hypothetical protein